MLNGWLRGLVERTFEANRADILHLIEGGDYPRMCDLGCDDGSWTMTIAKMAASREVYGVEIVPSRAAAARELGVQAVVADLNGPLPFESGFFDLVHANQVIEHVGEVDTFLSEIQRVLRTGGTAIIATENASSWHNIGAAILGWQTFSMTNVSPRALGVGNPLTLHHGSERGFGRTWTHKTVFNYRGLLEILPLYGLQPTAIRGVGYHPLPPSWGRLDVRHAHLLTVKAARVGDC